MSDTLRLLKFDPAVALLIMANNHLNIRLRSEFATVGSPIVKDDNGLTEVTISTRESIDEGIRRDYTGSIQYVFKRIHVADIFSNLVLDLTPPITVNGVLRNMSLATGLAISPDDFENALVEGSSFVLKAKSESLRWFGETTVMLNEPGVSIQLAEAFPNNVLDGLAPPVFEGPLSLKKASVFTKLAGFSAEG